jgi:hypothetical protein
MADPGSGHGGPDAGSQAAGAAAEAAASSSSGSSGPASTGMSDNFGMHDDSFGQQAYGGPDNLGGFSQDHVQASFNAVNQITSTNPFGKQGVFSRVLGIDPNNIDYSNIMDLSTRTSIANNQFSKFANPQNTPGQLGYNPEYASAPAGQVRSGVQKEGYKTAYGPVMEQARKQGIGEMLARGVMGLFGGPIGMLAGQLGTQEYGLPGQPGFDSFDPNNPQQGGGLLGAMLGGLNPTQAKEAITEFFSAPVAAPTKVGIESLTPASYETRADIAARTSKRGFAPPAANIQRTTSLSPSAGEQLAMGFKGLESGYSQQVYDELRDLIETGDPFVQPGNENMYGTDIPGVFDQDYNRNLGPVSGLPAGSFDVAGSSGGRTYQSGYQGQGGIYSPGGKGQTYYGGQQDKPFFDKFGTTAQEALDKLYGYVTG